jgi:hypothetical protein
MKTRKSTEILLHVQVRTLAEHAPVISFLSFNYCNNIKQQAVRYVTLSVPLAHRVFQAHIFLACSTQTFHRQT